MSKDTVDHITDNWARELPGVAGLGFELAKRTSRVSALLAERVNVELARHGLTKAEYEILAVLRASGTPYRLRPSDLAGRLLLSSGGTSNLLRRLTETGLVERESHAADARGSWVRLTRNGIDVAERSVQAASRAQAAALRDVPAKTARAASEALRQLLIALGDVPEPD